jgi:hypothetical protein
MLGWEVMSQNQKQLKKKKSKTKNRNKPYLKTEAIKGLAH